MDLVLLKNVESFFPGAYRNLTDFLPSLRQSAQSILLTFQDRHILACGIACVGSESDHMWKISQPFRGPTCRV